MAHIGSFTDKIVTAYKSGQTIKEIASHLEIGQGSVWRTLQAQGIKSRPHGLRQKTIRMPTDLELVGYIAGLFDADGNVQFRNKHGTSIGCKASIYNTNRDLIEWLEKLIGGNVLWDTKRTERHGWKPMGTWTLYRARDVAAFLKAVEPFIIVKRDATKAALALFDEVFGL